MKVLWWKEEGRPPERRSPWAKTNSATVASLSGSYIIPLESNSPDSILVMVKLVF